MIKILAYTDGKPASEDALGFAAALSRDLGAEMGVVTVRPGTHATEEPPPLGVEFPLENRDRLPHGLRILVDALELLATEGVIAARRDITIRDGHHGHYFVCETPSGGRVPFYERFGHFIEALNDEIAVGGYDLLVVAPPRHGGLTRLVMGDTTRKLALDLHASIVFVRGGGPGDRYVICADGSPAARRQFPLLRRLLPAITDPMEMIWVRPPDIMEADAADADACIRQAADWLTQCGKQVTIRREEAEDPAPVILEAAGQNAVIVAGASLRHDVYRRVMGSLPMRLLARTEATFMLVKLPPEADTDDMKPVFKCETE